MWIEGPSKVGDAVDGGCAVAPIFGCPVRKFHLLCLGLAWFGEIGGKLCLEILETLCCSSIANHPVGFRFVGDVGHLLENRPSYRDTGKMAD